MHKLLIQSYGKSYLPLYVRLSSNNDQAYNRVAEWLACKVMIVKLEIYKHFKAFCHQWECKYTCTRELHPQCSAKKLNGHALSSLHVHT